MTCLITWGKPTHADALQSLIVIVISWNILRCVSYFVALQSSLGVVMLVALGAALDWRWPMIALPGLHDSADVSTGGPPAETLPTWERAYRSPRG
jgi:hypothetical protein